MIPPKMPEKTQPTVKDYNKDTIKVERHSVRKINFKYSKYLNFKIILLIIFRKNIHL